MRLGGGLCIVTGHPLLSLGWNRKRDFGKLADKYPDAAKSAQYRYLSPRPNLASKAKSGAYISLDVR